MSLLEDFVKFLNANLPKAPGFHPYYEEALGVMLKAGGKHFRALLLLGVVESVDKSLTQKAMRVALGLEMMHTYSPVSYTHLAASSGLGYLILDAEELSRADRIFVGIFTICICGVLIDRLFLLLIAKFSLLRGEK